MPQTRIRVWVERCPYAWAEGPYAGKRGWWVCCSHCGSGAGGNFPIQGKRSAQTFARWHRENHAQRGR